MENCFVRKREAGDTERRRRKSGPSPDRKAGKKHDSDSEEGFQDVTHPPVTFGKLDSVARSNSGVKRKRVRFDFSPTVSLPTVPTQDSITGIESRTVQSVRCFPPRKPVSPCGLDGKPLGNLDDGYVATKASGRRKEQECRVRENDNNGNKCLWFSSSLAKKKNC